MPSAFDMATTQGPQVSKEQADRIASYIDHGRKEGARLLAGGNRVGDRGYFIEPTVFANVNNKQTIAQEEIFGPVLSVIPADSEEDAIDIANDTIFGLNSAVFTPDNARARAVAARLRSGTVGHNHMKLDMTIAFGGFKQSGLGREGGTEGLKSYLETKTVLLDGNPYV